MISQLDVAKAAGVSTTTASLALNNHPRVSAKTTLHVQTVAKRLGYVPNHAARQLIRSRFGSTSNGDLHQIGVVSCRRPSQSDSLNPTDMAFLNGVEQGVAARSGVLVYLRHADEASAKQITHLTHSGSVEGWITFGWVDDAHAALMDGLARPWVALGDHGCSRPVHQVNLDFRLMGQLAVRHLVELGHRRIGFVGSRMHFAYPKEILAGFREATSAAGLSLPAETVLLREVGPDPRPWLREALPGASRLASPPTAYVYAEPGESATMLAACSELGLRVPEAASLVFCEMTDGLPFAPDIARIEASAVEAGRAAVGLLADVASRKDVPARQVLVAPRAVDGWTAVANRGQ
jgi:DNA-binding LacI/PurR family transcriptional regulator